MIKVTILTRCLPRVASEASDVSRSVAEMSRTSALSCGGTVRVLWSARKLGKVLEDLNHEVDSFLVRIRA